MVSLMLEDKKNMVQTTEIALNEYGLLEKIKKPAVSKYGVYVIRQDNNVIRIGESSSGFDRISKGFKQKLRHVRNGKEKKNYFAYSWRNNFCNQVLHVDYFTLDEETFGDNHLRRALEAEITFQFRIAVHAWPQSMSEIHFLERYRTHCKLVEKASAIMSHYEHQYNHVI